MFAGGIESNVLLQYDIVIGCVKLFGKMSGRIFIESPVNLFAHSGNAIRGIQQPLSVNIFSDALQHKADTFFDLFVIHHNDW